MVYYKRTHFQHFGNYASGTPEVFVSLQVKTSSWSSHAYTFGKVCNITQTKACMASSMVVVASVATRLCLVQRVGSVLQVLNGRR